MTRNYGVERRKMIAVERKLAPCHRSYRQALLLSLRSPLLISIMLRSRELSGPSFTWQLLFQESYEADNRFDLTIKFLETLVPRIIRINGSKWTHGIL